MAAKHRLIFAGLTTAQAHRHHLMKMDLSNDIQGQANHAINPSPFSIAYMRRKWIGREFGGLNSPSMFEAKEKYAKGNPEVTLK